MNSLALMILVTGPSGAIPGPYWLFTVLHWVTLTLHFVAMNFLFGGIIIRLLAPSSPDRRFLFPEKLKAFPTAMAATITLGVAPLLFLQVIYGRYFYAASIISAWNWFLIVPVLIAVYYLLYLASLGRKLTDGHRVGLLALAAAGMIYVSFTFTMISDLAAKPYLWTAVFASSPAGWHLNPCWPETIFRWAHSITGGVAVAGIIIQLYAVLHRQVRLNPELIRFGGRIYLIALIKATVFAIIYLLTLDGDVLRRFLSSPGLHTLAAGIAVNGVIAFLIFRSTRSAKPQGPILSSAALTLLGVFLMVISRHYLRLVHLAKDLDPATLVTRSQWGPFFLFMVTFLIGISVTVWMIKRYFASPRPS